MILRVIHGRGAPGQLEAVAAALGEIYAPARPVESAIARLHLGQRRIPVEGESGGGDVAADHAFAHNATTRHKAADDIEICVLSCWRSAEAASAADARGTSPLAIARAELPDLSVEHFEIDETVLLDVDRPARVLRIATGQFSKLGADKEMLDVLRQRVPTIGAPMVEAHIGRRLVGREVRITFVSSWSEAPSGQDLRDAFWTDIALRYESFDVRVYEAVPIAGFR